MRVLLDTHAVLWALRSAQRLPAWLIKLLETTATEVVISAVTPWELGLKYHLGKLPEAEPVVVNWEACLTRLQAESLPITHRYGLVAAGLDWPHRDPFDRVLAAQAMVEGLPLVSADRIFDTVPNVDRWWDAPPPGNEATGAR